MPSSRTGLQCRLRPDEPPGRGFPFRIADRTLIADAPLAPFAPLAIAESTAWHDDRRSPADGSGRFVCRSRGWIANAWREVEVWRHGRELFLRVAGVGEFAASARGAEVVRLEAGIATTALAEVVLGPPLLLALALQGVWCLHAGAVAADGRVVAFAGESGGGKSTLAAYLNDAGTDGWTRVADDTLPVTLGSEGVAGLPHFPQLKLAAHEQYPVHAPGRLPVAALCVIAPAGRARSVRVHRLDPRQAMQALIRHTVAARLFDRSLLAAHLDFCAAAAARIPVWGVAYPHRLRALPQVADAIRRSIAPSGAGRGPGRRSGAASLFYRVRSASRG